MVFLNIDELLMDRVGHAAQVFGFELPKGVVFGLGQLETSLGMSRWQFEAHLAGGESAWWQSKAQPWTYNLVAALNEADSDYRLLGICSNAEGPSHYASWIQRELGTRGLGRLVTVMNNFPAPMAPGDILVDASESRGAVWKRRNGRFLQWQPYTRDHPQAGKQWLEVLSQGSRNC